MKTIRVQDITQSHRAISALDGEVVFKKIIDSFGKNQPVMLDFEGIDLTITAFLNSSIGKLYSLYSSVQIKELLDIKNLPSEEVQLLKLVIDRAKERFSKEYPDELDNIDFVNED
ncbi:uncharacterized protein DUF4325 [Roseivirga ehrenbergii]|uniref:DUF4325 domain-containing protein n=1 Tax=Roseivirga ehrenbergii (strain DSM 102268 / JCM 13514 / KCTC 12282 / NCIMB 14502 / KMM 6017) TaxID=279360 RepID=A0A150WZ46_ROSEK|nr:STAS-like domain-containing protein [Roseivirga ehrenbergii]KYG71761.1 hypothetical protein MB14_10625 [Roseivirga ehrenbergii]TCL07544.1 uncharacterized protein DUF4325 [Roseivirga ehrenbergii]